MNCEQEIQKLKYEIDDLCDTIKKKDKEIDDWNDVVDGLKDEIRDNEDRIEDLERDLQIKEDEEEYDNEIETGRGSIYWKADNLLDQQLMEAFKELVESKNNVNLLQLLQEMRCLQ